MSRIGNEKVWTHLSKEQIELITKIQSRQFIKCRRCLKMFIVDEGDSVSLCPRCQDLKTDDKMDAEREKQDYLLEKGE